MCGDCVTSTITTWVEYVLPTSTMTVWTTEKVVIDYSDTTTITYTLTNGDDSSATPPARRAKRGAIRNAILHDEDSSSIDDKGTSYITTPATSTSTDCFETAVATWVPYGDDQVVMGEDGRPSMSASASASSTSSKASKVYRQDPNVSSSDSSSNTASTQATTTPTTTTTTTSSDPPASTSSSTSSGNTSNAPAPAPASSNGGLYAMTYTPYDSSGGCMSAGAVLAQLQHIKSKGFPRIRMYGVDCNQLSTVADQAITLGFSLTLGVYIDHTGTARGNSDLQTLIAWGNWGAVDIITIGIIP